MLAARLVQLIARNFVHILALILLVAFSMIADIEVGAKVKKIKPNIVFEGDRIVGIGSKLKNTTAELFDGEGTKFGTTLNLDIMSAKKFRVTAPSVSSTKTLVLRFTDTSLTNGNTNDFPIVIFDKPDLSSPDPSPPDQDINVENVIAKGVVFNNRTLNASNGGDLRWNGTAFIDKSGVLKGNRVTLNGIALTADNGTLTWNSHTLATSAGGVSASVLSSIGAKAGTLTLNGATSLAFTNNGPAASLEVPGSGTFAGIARGEYDFAVDGGVTGTIVLRNATVPANARVIRAWYEVTTNFTSATNSTNIGLGITGDDATGIMAAKSIGLGSTPFAVGVHATDLNGNTAFISNKTTVARTLEMAVSGEAITAGKMVVFAEYVKLP